ncbi:MAG TPA: glycosyltransferase family 4 protein [Longimicrobiales bacterium]|nr:glycosyltransferase family 4 protein [Longimicrobiales bacterium]
MRVLHVNLARGFRGGERQTELLIAALADLDTEQWLVTRKASPLRQRLASVPRLRMRSARHPFAGHLPPPDVDVIHAHEAKAGHWAWLQHRLSGTPYIITRRVTNQVRDGLVNRKTYGDAAAAVAISSVIEDGLRALGRCPVARIPSVLAHLPADADEVARLRDRFRGRFVVGHVGAAVDSHKGQRVLLEAARRLGHELPDAVFLFVGGGEDLARLQRESAGMDSVLWFGSRDNVGDYLSVMDVFAFPSRHEGLGSALLDAMDYGVPIVASGVGGIPDIVQDGLTGLLVPPDRPVDLAMAIRRLHDDAELRRRLAANARARLDGFTPAAMAGRYLDLYRSVLAGKQIGV